MLCASVDDEQSESSLAEVKSQVKLILRRLGRNSEPQASIESGAYAVHYLIAGPEGGSGGGGGVVYLCIAERSYPRKLAFTYLADLAAEFSSSYGGAGGGGGQQQQQVHAPGLRPYAFMEFDTFVGRTRALYADSRAARNLGRLNDELRDVAQVMTKNIEDLLYRGDSLDRMGELSSRLRDDSRKYRRAAVRVNWDLLVRQYAPVAALVLFVLVFVWLRFF